MVRCGSKNEHQKDMCKSYVLHAQNMLNHSSLNGQHDWGGPIWPLNGDDLHFDNG